MTDRDHFSGDGEDPSPSDLTAVKSALPFAVTISKPQAVTPSPHAEAAGRLSFAATQTQRVPGLVYHNGVRL